MKTAILNLINKFLLQGYSLQTNLNFSFFLNFAFLIEFYFNTSKYLKKCEKLREETILMKFLLKKF